MPDLAALAGEFSGQVRELYYDLLRMGATALGLDHDFFVSHVLPRDGHFNINRYPPRSVTGPAKQGQYRVPRTPTGGCGRPRPQPGTAACRFRRPTEAGRTRHPCPTRSPSTSPTCCRAGPAALAVDQAPGAAAAERAPEEELISLIVFLDADVDTVIEPVTGNRELAPVVAGEWLRSRAASAAVSP